MVTLPFMAVRSCRVAIQDLEGVTPSVEVTAESLHEAVAQGLAALRRSDWVVGFQQGIVKVSSGRSRRASGQAGGFHEMAGENKCVVTKRDGSTPAAASDTRNADAARWAKGENFRAGGLGSMLVRED